MTDPVDIPPQHYEAECAVLGAVLLDNAAGAAVLEDLADDDFYFKQHRCISAAMRDLTSTNQPVDILTLTERLKAKGDLDNAGGASYVASLSNSVPSAANVEHYAKIIRDKRTLREIRHAATEILSRIREGGETDEIVAEAEKSILDAAQRKGGVRWVREVDVLREVLRRANDYDSPSERAITTPFPSIDAHVRVRRSDVVVAAAATGGGKSMFMGQWATHIGTGPKARPVAVVSLEMDPTELVERRLMDMGSLELDEVLRPRNVPAAERMLAASNVIGATSRIEYLEGAWDIRQVFRAALRRRKELGDLACVILDYLQILHFDREWGDTRDQQIGYVTRAAKRFAKDEGIPVIIASQLRRIDGRLPTKEDLRESGNIGNDANAVLIFYVPGFIQGTDEFEKGDKRTAKCLIAKQRQGRSMVEVPLQQYFEYGRFIEPPAEEMSAAERQQELPIKDRKRGYHR